jgi:hypothetical protein
VTDAPSAPAGLDAIPPAVRYRIREVVKSLPGVGRELDRAACERLKRLIHDVEPWLAADPDLVEVGHRLIQADQRDEMRQLGCIWLANFPTLTSIERLASLALDTKAPHPIREQAICALGDRQLRARHHATLWSPQAIQRADDVLVGLADHVTRAGQMLFAQLPIALRHVQWDGASAVCARAPGLWGSALECFGTPALARVVLVCVEDLPPAHRVRALRLSAALLGKEAVSMLRARAGQLEGDEMLEALLLVVALEGEAGLAGLEAAIRHLPQVDRVRGRAKWHLQHPGVIPTHRGLCIARSTAVIPPAERVDRCGVAADDLKILTRFARHAEPYLYRLWAWMVRASGDPARAGELFAVHPACQRDVRDLLFEDLARRGRVSDLVAIARAEGGADVGALNLAIWGKPLAALDLAETARANTPELVVARALACYRAGRPDLSERLIREDLLSPQTVDDSAQSAFPGPHELWMQKHAPALWPAATALVDGLVAIVALAKQAPFDGESDRSDLVAIAAIEQRLCGEEAPSMLRVRACSAAAFDPQNRCAELGSAYSPSVSGRLKPYRVAILLPEVRIDGPDAVLEREAALLLWMACIEACHLHPLLSALDASATPLVPQDGHLVPDAPEAAVLAAARRDEHIWFELVLSEGSASARLHTRDRHETRHSFEGAGDSVGERLRNAFNAWLSARSLDPALRAFGTVSSGEFLASVRAIAPWLVDHARNRSERSSRASSALPGERFGSELRSRRTLDQLSPMLRIAGLRLLEMASGDDLRSELIALDPDHPYALFAMWQSNSEAERDAAVIQKAIARAPGWDQPYRTITQVLDVERVRGQTLSRLEVVAISAMAAVHRPDSIEAVTDAAHWLVRTGRGEEAVRWVERMLQHYPEDRRAHLALLRTQDASERLGARLVQALSSSRLHGCPDSEPWSDDEIEIDLRTTSALQSVGRLDEAIALRAKRLGDREASWPGQARLLDRWRHEPKFLAQSYAREAYFRCDLARVAEGFKRCEPTDAIDLAMFVEALTALGREDEAVLAWAQFGLGHGLCSPRSRLAAANAFAGSARYRHAWEQLWRVELATPERDETTAIARCAIALRDTPLDIVEAAIDERLAAGATTLARRMARLVADYVPAAAYSPVIGDALGKRTETEFEPAWLAGFTTADRAGGRIADLFERIDRLFGELGSMRTAEPVDSDVHGESERGDRLVARWLSVVLEPQSGGDTGALASAAAYMAAQALARYFAATTFAASPTAGALRTVAGEALLLVYSLRASLSDRDARAVLVAIEPTLRRIDRWVGASWLAVTERCLGLDERTHGNIGGFVQDVPTVAARILGPEETAVLSWSVARTCWERREGWAAKVGAQASRLAMHTGSTALDEWAESIEAQLAAEEMELEDAVDALHTACYLAEGITAAPCVRAARVLFDSDRAHVAFEVLATGFGAAPGRTNEWRDLQLDGLRQAWQRAGLEVPIDFGGGAGQLFAALRQRDPMHSERLGRWAAAYDPSDAEAHRYLGLALAAQRKTVEAMQHLVLGAGDQAGELLVAALQGAGFLDEAQMVRSYLAHRQTPTPHEYPGQSTDDDDDATPVTVIAEMVGGTEGGASHAVGDNDVEPELHAELAEAAIPIGAEVVEVMSEPRHPVYALLELGNYEAAATKVRDPSWRVRCAGLCAVRFRRSAENQVGVTERAIAAANQILADAVGDSDRFVPFARALALHIREQAYFSSDPPPPLGNRMSRDAFDREFRIRSGGEIDARTLYEPGFSDSVVFSNSKIARASDYVALLRDLAQLSPEEALAQFGLDADGYLEVAKAWTEAMRDNPTLTNDVEAGLSKR